jgi:hypothetical protein
MCNTVYIITKPLQLKTTMLHSQTRREHGDPRRDHREFGDNETDPAEVDGLLPDPVEAVLGDVVDEFFQTNSRAWRNIDAIIDASTKWNGIQQFASYRHSHLPYLASLGQFGGTRGTWLYVKLVANGFFFAPRRGSRIQRHDHHQWIRITSMKLSCGISRATPRRSITMNS